jgi:hypothetical protein
MNLDPVPERTVQEIQALTEAELAKIQDADILAGLRIFLVEPCREMRIWDWRRPHREYPVWAVAESSVYDYGIVYSDYGFAPEHPWGLVFSSHNNFDADYCWLASLESAYRDSRLLEEWNESKQTGD